jgi:Holliday junction resolvasome RuvABC endonuclease subunit
MNVKKLQPTPAASRVLGIDGSSKSLAFCMMVRMDDVWVPEQWGKLEIVGRDVFERCGDLNSKLYGIMKMLHPDHVTVESVIYVNNRAVVIQLAKIIGAALGVIVATGRTANEVAPTTWMNYIGNNTRDTKETKQALRKAEPGQSTSWYKNELRKQRKQRTLDWVHETYGIDIDDDDVGDAFGIAFYATMEHVK